MPRKAKRNLSEIDFSKEGGHVALTCKAQSGPANGHDYALLLKSSQRSPEFIQKASMVKVEMEITEYLRKFFGLYWEDAEVLARSMGYITKELEDEMEDAAEGESEETYQSYIASKVNSIEIIKSLKSSDNLIKAVSTLTEDEYLSVLKDQELVEKALKEYSPVTKSNKELETMPQAKVPEVKEETVAELIAKSQFDLVQKALDENKVELQKALELVEQFKQKEKEAITKARFEVLKAAVKDTAKAEVIFKALNLVQDETEFQAVVKAVGDLALQVEQSNLFSEQGVSGDAGEAIEENPVAKILKAKYGPKQ